jgi:hypothetical protein
MKTKTIREKIEHEIFDIESSIEDALSAARNLINFVENSEDLSDYDYRSLKEAAASGLQTMIDKYGHSSNEVLNVEKFIESK